MEYPTFEVSGSTTCHRTAYDEMVIHDIVQVVNVRAEVETAEHARAIRDSFPKSWRVRGGPCSGFVDGQHKTFGLVSLDIDLLPNGTNEGVNETGLNRLKSLLKRVPWTYKKAFAINYASERQIIELIEGKRSN